MSHKPSILFINIAQYGNHTDSYKSCEYLNKSYDVDYLCFDKGYKKIKSRVNIKYLSDTGSSIRNIIKIIKISRKLIKKNNYDLIHITYFQLSSLLTIAMKESFLLDIRTSSVDKGKYKRFKYNFGLKLESYFFKHISIISESLRRKLNLNYDKCTVIPLGADKISLINKSYNNLHLFYIGGLDDRDIFKTVSGLAKFIQYNKDDIEISYDIFGEGNKEEIMLLKNSIKQNKLESIVKYHGRKEHYEIKNYFDKCNLGVAFVPMTEYYDCQPPTKIFEYINSGMVCLATNTSENKMLINKHNGILHDDNDESFKDALIEFTEIKYTYSSTIINKTLQEYTWDNILEFKLKPLIEKLCKESEC